MKFLKYFENITELYKIVSPEEYYNFENSHVYVDMNDSDKSKVDNMLNGYKYIKTELKNKRLVIFAGHQLYHLYLCDDEYFILVKRHIRSSDTYIIDGWDGLNQIFKKIISY